MKIYFNPETDPAWNLALEECMTRSLRGPGFMLWQNRPSVIVGRNQNTMAEINMPYLRSHNIPAVRRITGGGTVYHDYGNLNYSCMADMEDQAFADFAPFAQPILHALRSLGLECVFSGRNDILIGERKISGTAKTVSGKRILFHGTLLFDADLGILEEILTPDPDKITFKGIRSVRARVANIKEFLPGLTSETFREQILSSLLRQAGKTSPDVIPEELIKEATELANTKYRTDEWNMGASPACTFHRKQRFPGGTVAVALEIRQGVMEHVSITGDFFGEREIAGLETLLCGKRYSPEVIRETLSGCELEKYLLNIPFDGFLNLFE